MKSSNNPGYQSLPRKTRRNVSDSLPVIKVFDDIDIENHYQEITTPKNNYQQLKQSYLRSASVPNLVIAKKNVILHGIHKSPSAGGKYDTEDYVFM